MVMNDALWRYERELRANPALVARVLSKLPAASPVLKAAKIQTDCGSLDGAILKALVLAAIRIETKIKLIGR